MPRRPLDVLEDALGDVVTVTLKDQTNYVGRLAGFDQHLNVVLEGATGSGDDGQTTRSGDGPDEDDPDLAAMEEAPEQPGGDTIVIRGDNVVTITP